LVFFVNSRYSIVSLSRGGTTSAFESTGVSVIKLEQLTLFPEMIKEFLVLSVLDFNGHSSLSQLLFTEV